MAQNVFHKFFHQIKRGVIVTIQAHPWNLLYVKRVRIDQVSIVSGL
jgi:hypothetical protein